MVEDESTEGHQLGLEGRGGEIFVDNMILIVGCIIHAQSSPDTPLVAILISLSTW